MSRPWEDSEVLIIWRCSKCNEERRDSPGYNEGGDHSCGGEWRQSGESFDMGGGSWS